MLLRMYPLTLGDENVVRSRAGSLELDYQAWSGQLLSRLTSLLAQPGRSKTCDTAVYRHQQSGKKDVTVILLRKSSLTTA
jgi:hypothetical protein